MVQCRAARFFTWPTGREPQNGPTQGCKVHHLTNRQGTSKWSNAGLQGLSPDQQAGNLKMDQRRAARFVTWPTGREHACSVGDMFQYLNWLCLEDKRKDARLDMMYIIASQNVAIYQQTDLSHPWDNHSTCIPRLSLSLLMRLNKDNNGFLLVQYNLTETGCHSL
jgi:hypothetical protein